MALPTWGNLEKAQDDPETIEQAIDRKIQNHLDNADAHALSGESLETHKGQTVIDHPAGSVIADKDTMTEFITKDPLKDLTGWNTAGDVSIGNWPGVSFYVESGYETESKIYAQVTMPPGFFNPDYDMVFQTSAYFSLSYTLYDAWLGIGIQSYDPADGFGFVFRDGVTKAVFSIGSTRNYSGEITNDETTEHIYRAQYNATTQEATFYIDGVKVATISKPSGSVNYDIAGCMGISIDETNDGEMITGGVIFSRGV